MGSPLRRLSVEIISTRFETVEEMARQITNMVSHGHPDLYLELVLHPIETAEEAIKNIARTKT